MHSKRKQRSSVCVQPVAIVPQILNGFVLEPRNVAEACRLVISRKRVQHECLHIEIQLFIDQCLVQESRAALKHVGFDVDAGAPGQAETPDDVSRHEMIAFTILPPTPASVRVLKSVQAVEPLFDHLIELAKISRSPGMSLIGRVLLDAAEDSAHYVFRLEAQIRERLSSS